MSGQVADEIEETLRAALADPAAASAVRSGLLTSALSYAGFGESDGSDAVGLSAAHRAPVAPAAVKTPRAADRSEHAADREAADRETADREAADREAADRHTAVQEATLALRAAEEAAQHAQGAALVAEQHRDSVLRRTSTARGRLDAAHTRVAELESQLTSARTAASTAAAAWAPLHAEADAASVRAETARGLADRAGAMRASARAHLADVESGEGSPR